jgi:hypothetical protein
MNKVQFKKICDSVRREVLWNKLKLHGLSPRANYTDRNSVIKLAILMKLVKLLKTCLNNFIFK